jgi:hypothetical protein
MAEAALAILIVSTMLVTALNMVGMSARARSINAGLGKGPALAHGLMSEVLQAYYANPETEPILVEGPEIELASHDPSPSATMEFDVKNKLYVGQVFQPTLPADAVSWSVTRVKFQAQYAGDQDGIASVQLRPLDDSGEPTSAIIEKYSLPETKLPSSFGWTSLIINATSGLTPGSGLALIIAVQKDDNVVCKILYDVDEGGGMVRTADGGATWSGTNFSMPFYIYGKVTTESSLSNSIGPEIDEGTSTRLDFDDVDDYDGWTASPPQEKDGTELTEYAGWTRNVTVEFVDAFAPGGSATVSDTGAKRITVTVTDPRGAETTVVSVRTKSGTYEHEVTATRTYCSWIGLDLQIGEANAALSLGASLANEPVVTK